MLRRCIINDGGNSIVKLLYRNLIKMGNWYFLINQYHLLRIDIIDHRTHCFVEIDPWLSKGLFYLLLERLFDIRDRSCAKVIDFEEKIILQCVVLVNITKNIYLFNDGKLMNLKNPANEEWRKSYRLFSNYFYRFSTNNTHNIIYYVLFHL